MNGTVLLLGASLVLVIGYLFYGRFLKRLFDIDAVRPTPAHTQTDGVDYVPTRFPILFGHHFASIAGAGPIVGPVLGAYIGWGPVVLWLLLGGLFIGAMHDFAALFLSVRTKGRSIGHVIEAYAGYGGRQLFLIFAWAALILVVAIFAILVARTFVVTPAVATASIFFILLAPLFGFLVYRKGISIVTGSLIFVPLVFGAIGIGQWLPLDLTQMFGVEAGTANLIWITVLLVYVLFASILPVWTLLQPRDYLNSYLLYAMLLAGFAGILVTGPAMNLDAFAGWTAVQPDGAMSSIFPLLFVTVACGACSGFHALVATGTTAKQIDRESHILPIGYGGMLVETILGIMSLISVAVLTQADYRAALGPGGAGPVSTFASGIAGFIAKLGLPHQVGITFISLAISAFMLTTLDTATRLARFTWQEMFLGSREAGSVSRGPFLRWFNNRVSATLIVIALAGYLAFSGNGQAIWPVFGASNQLLAALTLLVVTLYLQRRKANFWIALVPMLFMFAVSLWALFELFEINRGKNPVLVVAILFFMIMAMVLALKGAVVLFAQKTRPVNTNSIRQ